TAETATWIQDQISVPGSPRWQGEPEAGDNCPKTPNPDQDDGDGDGVGDACQCLDEAGDASIPCISKR
ncbi:MAG TPA: hypothetical protein VLS89_17640, partial [Candidatus Nanopelagicales bacterium]|nr:hypothetical protein [Candidatus Nanopelagicales bacterium]